MTQKTGNVANKCCNSLLLLNVDTRSSHIEFQAHGCQGPLTFRPLISANSENRTSKLKLNTHYRNLQLITCSTSGEQILLSLFECPRQKVRPITVQLFF